MAERVVGSYLYELKPFVDTKKWKDASGEIDSAIKSSKFTYDEWKGKKQQFREQIAEISKLKGDIEALEKKTASMKDGVMKDALLNILGTKKVVDKDGVITTAATGKYAELDKLESKASVNRELLEMMAGSGKGTILRGQLSEGFSKLSSAYTKISGTVTGIYGVLKNKITKSIKQIEDALPLANSLNARGAFGDMGIRDLMSRYGVSSTRATAMDTVMDLMGISESDFGRLTDVQRKTYDELVRYYEAGIEKIDTGKLKEYYDLLDEFQFKQSQYKIDLQTTMLKNLAESNSFKRLVGSVEHFFEKTIDFIDSDAFKWFMDAFLDFLGTIVDLASGLMSIVAPNSSSGGTVNNRNSVNTYYIYGNEYTSGRDLARSIALEQDGGSIG